MWSDCRFKEVENRGHTNVLKIEKRPSLAHRTHLHESLWHAHQKRHFKFFKCVPHIFESFILIVAISCAAHIRPFANSWIERRIDFSRPCFVFVLDEEHRTRESCTRRRSAKSVPNLSHQTSSVLCGSIKMWQWIKSIGFNRKPHKNRISLRSGSTKNPSQFYSIRNGFVWLLCSSESVEQKVIDGKWMPRCAIENVLPTTRALNVCEGYPKVRRQRMGIHCLVSIVSEWNAESFWIG